MTYENWCKHSSAIIKEAEAFNEWADKAKSKLLTNIGPRLAKLGKSGYMGCGFHYSLEQTFGKLIVSLAISWQPCANWCQNVEEDRQKAMIAQVCYRSLMNSIKKAERSVTKFRKICGKA